MKLFFLIILTAFLWVACNNTQAPAKLSKSAEDVPLINFKIVKQFAHDTTSFTEGFLVHNGQLFESTGSPQDLPETRSIFGEVDVETGKINKKVELNKATYFGEGIVFLMNKVYQLTYKNQICFVYDDKNYKKIGQFKYPNKEGWGLTTDGRYIIMSDGTLSLQFINPSDFKIVRTIQVSANDYAIDNLNELEYIKGYIYANVWPTNKIVKIDPANGHVVGKLDLTLLKEMTMQQHPRLLEANGIAYDSVSNKIYITGKMWPTIYQIELVN